MADILRYIYIFHLNADWTNSTYVDREAIVRLPRKRTDA